MELELKNVTKRYGAKTALEDFTYTFKEGIYGILGANGSGKSTLMHLITDNIKRDGGSITWDGAEILSLGNEFRRVLGFMPQQQGLYESMTAATFIAYIARLKDIRDVKGETDRVLALTNLSDVRHGKLYSFSGGMRQRVLLAQAMLGDPKVLILDEPTAGLDPRERVQLRNHIRDLSRERTVLLATHILSDIETIADEILLLRAGRLVRSGAPAALVAEENCATLEEVCLRYIDDDE